MRLSMRIYYLHEMEKHLRMHMQIPFTFPVEVVSRALIDTQNLWKFRDRVRLIEKWRNVKDDGYEVLCHVKV